MDMLKNLGDLIGSDCTTGQAVQVLSVYTICFTAIVIALIITVAVVIGIRKGKK